MWIKLGLAILFSLLEYILAPKPKTPDLKPGQVTGVPKTAPGTEIPRTYGTVWIMDPQVAWWGDLSTVAIKSGGKKK